MRMAQERGRGRGESKAHRLMPERAAGSILAALCRVEKSAEAYRLEGLRLLVWCSLLLRLERDTMRCAQLLHNLVEAISNH